MSNIVQSPQAMHEYLAICKQNNVREVTVKIPTGKYTQKKYSTKIFGFTLSAIVEEENYVSMTFKF